MSTQNYREIAAISAMHPQARDKAILIFFNGVLVPKEWKILSAVTGNEGYIVRYVTEDGYILRTMEPSGYLVPATVTQRGRVSVRVPTDYFPEYYGQFGGRFPRIKPEGDVPVIAFTGCITADKIKRQVLTRSERNDLTEVSQETLEQLRQRWNMNQQYGKFAGLSMTAEELKLGMDPETLRIHREQQVELRKQFEGLLLRETQKRLQQFEAAMREREEKIHERIKREGWVILNDWDLK